VSLVNYIKLAHGLLATTYGFGEYNCGPTYDPRPCDRSAVTASGERFNPDSVTAAVAAPDNVLVRPRYIAMRVDGGSCLLVRVNDKMNPRFIGERGFDLTPAAVEYLTGEPARRDWSGRVYLCDERDTVWEKRLNLARLSSDLSSPLLPHV